MSAPRLRAACYLPRRCRPHAIPSTRDLDFEHQPQIFVILHASLPGSGTRSSAAVQIFTGSRSAASTAATSMPANRPSMAKESSVIAMPIAYWVAAPAPKACRRRSENPPQPGRFDHCVAGATRNLEQDPRDQFRRSGHNRGALHERNRARRIRAPAPRNPRSRSGGLQGRLLLRRGACHPRSRRAEFPGRRKFITHQLAHASQNRLLSALPPQHCAPDSARPRFNLDFTVPSGTFSTCAISRYSNSSRSRKDHRFPQFRRKFLQSPLQQLARLAPGHQSLGPRRSSRSSPRASGSCSSIESVARSSLVRR